MTIARTLSSTRSARRLVLQHVLVLHRHGDRSPDFVECGANLNVGQEEIAFWTREMPSSERLAELNQVGKVVGHTPEVPVSESPLHIVAFPCGNVTSRGLARMERLGESLRARYADFVDPAWSNDRVFVQSTNFHRTIQSVQAVLRGLFPSAQDRHPFFIRVNNALVVDHPMSVFDNLGATFDANLAEKYGANEYAALRERAYTALGADRSQAVPWCAGTGCTVLVADHVELD